MNPSKRDGYAIHRVSKGQQGLRGGGPARAGGARPDGQVQRRAGEGGRDAGGRRGAGVLPGGARHLRREQAHGAGRPVYRIQGAGGGILDLAGEEQGRSGRMGQADSVPGRRSGDPPSLRGRRFRCRAHAGAARTGGPAARCHRQEQTTLGEMTMPRFMTIVKGPDGGEPSPALIERIGKLGEEGARKGVRVEMGGLAPTALGARARLSKGKITVTEGPFTEAKEVIGGFAIYDVPSKQEAIEWTRRFLEAHIGLWDKDLEVEIRLMMDD